MLKEALNDPNSKYRKMISGKYIVIYKIHKNKVIVMSIFSAKQKYLNSNKFILREKSLIYKLLNR